MTEEWRAVPGYEGAYEVSSLGRVRSLDRVVESPTAKRGYPKLMRGRLLKPQRHSAGYLHVGLSRRIRIISHLVLEAFRGPRPDGEEACHNNGDKWNNVLGNLRWGTHTYNCADRVAHGTSPDGEQNAMCKLSLAEVVAIRARYGPETQRALGAEFGVVQGHVSRIVTGRRRSRG